MRKLPTKVKELQGTLEKSRVPKNEVQYSKLIDAVPMPQWWPPNVQAIYKSYIVELQKVSLLFKTDLPVLQRYCFAVYQAQEAERNLSEEGFVIAKTNHKGDTYETTSDWLTVLKNANSIIDRFSAKFGFSPVDKTNIEVEAIEKANDKSLLR